MNSTIRCAVFLFAAAADPGFMRGIYIRDVFGDDDDRAMIAVDGSPAGFGYQRVNLMEDAELRGEVLLLYYIT